MRFDCEELFDIAIREYREADFLKDGAEGFSQREGLRAWAYESEDCDYEDEKEVVDEIKRYIKEEKSFES